MRPIRRHDLAPRFEMMPMIDVIFLLLTFFIYSMVLMVRSQVLPVTLTAMASGGAPAAADQIQAVTIDRGGQLYFNRASVSESELDERLSALAQQQPQPMLFLALEAEGDVDRGPMLVRLLERVTRAGISRYTIVGQPPSAP